MSTRDARKHHNSYILVILKTVKADLCILCIMDGSNVM